MRIQMLRSWPGAALLAALASFGWGVPAFAATAPEAQHPHSHDVLEGPRHESLLGLAHQLDERARHAAAQAELSAHHGDRNEGRFIDRVRHFAKQAADFHRDVDRGRLSPRDVSGRINHLTRDARRVNEEIRAAHVFEDTWDDWDATLDVLKQMDGVVMGHGHD